MFSNDIVGSDAFLEMPMSSQSLYFHLGMRCDDDGFVNPLTTMRMTGANKNDLDILVAKRFLIAFKNGVVVIKHNRINNNWDSRDSKRTLYTEELAQLYIKENRAYTLDENQGVPVDEVYGKQLPSETRRVPVGRIEENRREEIREEEKKDVANAPSSPSKKFIKPTVKEIKEYCDERKNGIDPQSFYDYYQSKGWVVGRSPMKDWKASVRTWERRNGYSESTRSNGPAINLDDKSAVDKLLSKKK